MFIRTNIWGIELIPQYLSFLYTTNLYVFSFMPHPMSFYATSLYLFSYPCALRVCMPLPFPFHFSCPFALASLYAHFPCLFLCPHLLPLFMTLPLNLFFSPTTYLFQLIHPLPVFMPPPLTCFLITQPFALIITRPLRLLGTDLDLYREMSITLWIFHVNWTFWLIVLVFFLVRWNYF